MNWIKEKPSINGYYWLKSINLPPVIVEVNVEQDFVLFTDGADYDLEEMIENNCEWYGPLKSPE